MHARGVYRKRSLPRFGNRRTRKYYAHAVGDTTAPSAPSPTGTIQYSIVVSWAAIAPVGPETITYRVYRNSVELTTLPGQTGTSYAASAVDGDSFDVVARDSSGNESAAGNYVFTGPTGGGSMTAADIRDAIGMASANLDTQLTTAHIRQVAWIDANTIQVYFDRPVVAAVTPSPNSNFRINGSGPDAVTAQTSSIITLDFTSSGPHAVGEVWQLSAQPNWLTTAVSFADGGLTTTSVSADIAAVKTDTGNLATRFLTMVETPGGGVYRYTAAALVNAPLGDGGTVVVDASEIAAALAALSPKLPVNVVQVNGAADPAASIGAANILKVVLHDSTTAHVYFDRPVVAAATGSPNSNFRIDGNAPDAVTAQSQTIITLNYTSPANGPIGVGNVWVLASQPNWLTTAVNLPDQGVVVADEVGDLLAFAVPGGYAPGMAGYELGRLATIAGSTALISTGGNTFRSPIQNGTIHIPQGMNWTNNTLAAIQILQDGGNWPDLSEYPAAGSNGIFLELSIRPQYTNVAGYNPTNSASFSFACTASGTSPDQIISIRPGTPTTNLQPRNDAGDGPNGPPYTAQVWAINGSDEVLLFSGLADVVDNIRS